MRLTGISFLTGGNIRWYGVILYLLPISVYPQVPLDTQPADFGNTIIVGIKSFADNLLRRKGNEFHTSLFRQQPRFFFTISKPSRKSSTMETPWMAACALNSR